MKVFTKARNRSLCCCVASDQDSPLWLFKLIWWSWQQTEAYLHLLHLQSSIIIHWGDLLALKLLNAPNGYHLLANWFALAAADDNTVTALPDGQSHKNIVCLLYVFFSKTCSCTILMAFGLCEQLFSILEIWTPFVHQEIWLYQFFTNYLYDLLLLGLLEIGICCW